MKLFIILLQFIIHIQLLICIRNQFRINYYNLQKFLNQPTNKLSFHNNKNNFKNKLKNNFKNNFKKNIKKL